MVLFQYYAATRGGGIWSNLFYWLDYWGFRDFFLPFILIFTIFYAVLQQINLFGSQSKKYNVVLSLVIGLLVVVPHVIGAYPPQYDVVNMINSALPEIALLVIGIVMLMLMLGLVKGGRVAYNWITLLAVGLLVLIFVSAISPQEFWLSRLFNAISPEVQELLVMLIVFGLIFAFLTHEKPAQGEEGTLEKLWKWLKKEV